MVTTISDNAEKHSNLHFKIIFNWKVIALQCYVGFCHSATYNSSFGSSCTSHILFILFTQPRRYHPCIWCSVRLLSCVWLFVIPRIVAYQDPLSMGFSRQKYWSRLPFSRMYLMNKCFWALISQTFLFLVTPCWMLLSTFLFPLTRHLFLSLCDLWDFHLWIICELFLELFMESKLLRSRPYDFDLYIIHVPSMVYRNIRVGKITVGADKGFE